MPLSIEQALYKELVATAGVVALVGTRVYPVQAPQGTSLPYVTYEVLRAHPIQEHSGSGGLNGLRISYLCHAPTYAGAKGIAAAIRAAFEGRSGTVQGVSIGHLLLDVEADAGFDETTKMYVVAVDYKSLHG